MNISTFENKATMREMVELSKEIAAVEELIYSAIPSKYHVLMALHEEVLSHDYALNESFEDDKRISREDYDVICDVVQQAKSEALTYRPLVSSEMSDAVSTAWSYLKSLSESRKDKKAQDPVLYVIEEDRSDKGDAL